jgi:hypothetical protein
MPWNNTGTQHEFSIVSQLVIRGLANKNKTCTFGVITGLPGEDSGPGHFGNAMK